MKIEMYDLWTQACLYLSIHLVTGFYKGFSQFHVVSSQSIVSSQCQSTRQKANQVILQDKTTLTGEKITQQTGICVCASLCPYVCVLPPPFFFFFLFFKTRFGYQELESNFLTIWCNVAWGSFITETSLIWKMYKTVYFYVKFLEKRSQVRARGKKASLVYQNFIPIHEGGGGRITSRFLNRHLKGLHKGQKSSEF